MSAIESGFEIDHGTGASRGAQPCRELTVADLGQARAFLVGLSAPSRQHGFGQPMTERVMAAYAEMELRESLIAAGVFVGDVMTGLAVVMAGSGANHTARIAYFIDEEPEFYSNLDNLIDKSLRLASADADVVTVPIADPRGAIASALRARGASIVVNGGLLLAMLRIGNDAYRWIDHRPLVTHVESVQREDLVQAANENVPPLNTKIPPAATAPEANDGPEPAAPPTEAPDRRRASGRRHARQRMILVRSPVGAVLVPVEAETRSVRRGHRELPASASQRSEEDDLLAAMSDTGAGLASLIGAPGSRPVVIGATRAAPGARTFVF
jgi:hypothetical protein